MTETPKEVSEHMAKIGSKGGKSSGNVLDAEHIKKMVAGNKARRRKIKKWIRQGMSKSAAAQRWKDGHR